MISKDTGKIAKFKPRSQVAKAKAKKVDDEEIQILHSISNALNETKQATKKDDCDVFGEMIDSEPKKTEREKQINCEKCNK